MDALPWGGGGIGLLWPLDFFWGKITGVHQAYCWVVLRPMMVQLLVRYSGRLVLEFGLNLWEIKPTHWQWTGYGVGRDPPGTRCLQ